ncbi:MAG: hypothetical protein GTO55_05105, partial [Armatimonadetes bacterium]|nr:hypothetical protein [Armatimonadota bacterium]
LIKYKTLMTVGIGESALNEKIRDLMASPNPSVGTLAGAGMVGLRVAAKAEDGAHADAMIAEMERNIRVRLGEYVYGEDDVTLEGVVGALLLDLGRTLAIYESVTAGAVCHRLSRLPGHRQFFAGGVVATQGEMRRMVWDGSGRVDMEGEHASMEGTKRLADGVRRLCGADIGLA